MSQLSALFSGLITRLDTSAHSTRTPPIRRDRAGRYSTEFLIDAYGQYEKLRRVVFRLDLNLSAIVWLTPDGKTPSDGAEAPDCFLSGLANGLGVSCEAALIVANVIGIACLLTVATVAFLVYKRR